MALTAAPYGLRPINRIDGMPYAGATSQFLIDPTSGAGTNLFYGQVVLIDANGYIALSTATGADLTTNTLGGSSIGAWGVFVGCSYTNPSTKQKVFAQYWPTGTVASDAVAYVVDDDRAVFQVQADGSLGVAALGANVYLSAVQSTSTGSTTSGNSNTSVSATAVTTTAAFRVVGFVDMVGFSTVGDAYTDILVKFNPGYHSYSNAVGL